MKRLEYVGPCNQKAEESFDFIKRGLDRMEEKKLQSLSKFLSLILRHKPETIGLALDEHGWAKVSDLLRGMQNAGKTITMGILEEIVRTDAKGRYCFNEDKTLIRANQGHSISVDVELQKLQPPEVLYHGTAAQSLSLIQQNGLKAMGRLYVHLCRDIATARKVGQRHGEPIVLTIDTKRMWQDGFEFFYSKNAVWLTKFVPVQYLSWKSSIDETASL